VQTPEDLDALVDEAIDESFPASDPPSFWARGAEDPEVSDAAAGRRLTTDPKTIRRWVENRGGAPAIVKTTEGELATKPQLRLHLPNDLTDPLVEDIDWETFFREFEERGLVFVYEDKGGEGDDSDYYEIVARSSTKI
jgi:hypothetical protein